MQLKITRLLSVFMAVCLLFMLCVPAFASSDFTYDQKVGFWSWTKNVPILSDLIGYSVGWVCAESDDGYHHANSCLYEAGDYYRCICSCCGKEFTAYESDIQQSYDNYVSELPVPGYNSSGNLIWYVNRSSVSGVAVQKKSNGNWIAINSTTASGEFTLTYTDFYCDFQFSWNYSSDYPIYDLRSRVSIKNFPVSGSYRRLDACAFAGSIVTSSVIEGVKGTYSSGPYSHYDPDSTVNIYSMELGRSISRVKHISINFYYPVFEVIPDTALSGDQYNITTRPTTITGGNYGIVGDNGQITRIEDNSTIINETNNIYYNPATGQKETILDWSYNYTDRSYNITLESGDTVTVTYGDQNITIVEGDTNYTIYYIIDGSGSGSDPNPGVSSDPDSSTHIHNWQETSRIDPTCTAPGQILYICAECGQTRSEVLKTTGHTWQVERTVQTSYDDEGNLIEQGYTIYQCSVCGEQYKDNQGTGPPGGSGNSDDDGKSIWDKLGEFFGTILGGIIGMIEAVIGKILDALIALGKMIMDKLAAVVDVVLSIFDEVPKLFGGFLAFLSAMFPFLPDEIMLLLTFGIAAVVFVGIIKAIRR